MILFLKAKGWQLFVGFLAFAFIGQFIPITVATLVIMILFGGWLYAIASEANNRVDIILKKSNKWMLIGLFYAGVYVAFTSIYLAGQVARNGIPSFMIPLHLLAMCAIFYALLVAARRLVTYERQAVVGFYEYSGPFFLLWFFPVGIWFIQPRVNKMLESGIEAKALTRSTSSKAAEPKR